MGQTGGEDAFADVADVVPQRRWRHCRAGHDLRWASGSDASMIVAAAGIQPVVAGMTAVERRDEYFRRYPEARELPPEELPGHMFPRLFGTVSAPRMRNDLLAFVAGWRPDLVVHEAAEPAAPIVTAVLGVPTVNQGYGALVPPTAWAQQRTPKAALGETLSPPRWGCA